MGCGVEVMSAEIIALDRVRLRVSQKSATAPQAARADRFQYWVGASNERYIHSVYSLITCPEVADANYLLCYRNPETSETVVLRVGVVGESAPSLNLAALRHMAATSGANEVHLHLLAGTAKQAKLIAYDLQTALQGHDDLANSTSH